MCCVEDLDFEAVEDRNLLVKCGEIQRVQVVVISSRPSRLQDKQDLRAKKSTRFQVLFEWEFCTTKVDAKNTAYPVLLKDVSPFRSQIPRICKRQFAIGDC